MQKLIFRYGGLITKGYRIIGISGKAGSGKDTVANILVDTYKFTRIGFADYLKELAKKYLSISEQEIIDKSQHIRTILQGLGLCFRENVHPDYWVHHLQH